MSRIVLWITPIIASTAVDILLGAGRPKRPRASQMPHVAVPSAARVELLESARGRWDALLARHPDLAPAVDLQRRLLTLVIEQADGSRGGRLPRLSLPPRYLAAKLGRGVPVVRGRADSDPRARARADAPRALPRARRGRRGRGRRSHPREDRERRHRRRLAARRLALARPARDPRGRRPPRPRARPGVARRRARRQPVRPRARSARSSRSRPRPTIHSPPRSRRGITATARRADRGRRSPKSPAATACCAARSARTRGS